MTTFEVCSSGSWVLHAQTGPEHDVRSGVGRPIAAVLCVVLTVAAAA